jgi:hypothetical protein
MKTFKEYRSENKGKDTFLATHDTAFAEMRKNKDQPYPIMETSFGTHSLKKSDQPYPTMETSFGTHSLPKSKKLDEAKIHKEPEPTAEQHEQLHDAAPMAGKLSEKAKEALSDYTDESCGLNGMLHRHSKGQEVHTGTHASNMETVKNLDKTLDRQSTNEDIYVYTGLNHSPSKYFKDRTSKNPVTVHLPAFTSTSTSPKTARGFSKETFDLRDEDHGIDAGGGRHFLKIAVPKGTKASSVKKQSFVPEENEILLHRGHNIEIHHTPTKLADDTYMWHAKVVSHTPQNLDKL